MHNNASNRSNYTQYNDLKYIKNEYNKRMFEQILTIRLKMLSLTKEHTINEEKSEKILETSEFQIVPIRKNDLPKAMKGQNNKMQAYPIKAQNKSAQRNEFFMQLLKHMHKKTKSLKNKMKQSKALPLEEIFIIEKSHVCSFCGQIFERPCALGGHTSKLHSK